MKYTFMHLCLPAVLRSFQLTSPVPKTVSCSVLFNYRRLNTQNINCQNLAFLANKSHIKLICLLVNLSSVFVLIESPPNFQKHQKVRVEKIFVC